MQSQLSYSKNKQSQIYHILRTNLCRMGVRYLSQQLRPANETPDEMSTSAELQGKRIGVDFSVIPHKAQGTKDGATEFLVKPPVPYSEVLQRCNRLCGYAKMNNITLVVCIDGKYHPMKESVNAERATTRDAALEEVEAILGREDINEKLKSDDEELKKVLGKMKKATRVTDTVIGTAIEVFKRNGHEVYGAPYEADFQLVYWEITGFTHGTATIDSDIFAMGSELVVDLIN